MKWHAAQIHKLDGRLETIGTLLFAATLLVSIATIIGYANGGSLIAKYGDGLTLFGRFSGAWHRSLWDPIPRGLRRRCRAIDGNRGNAPQIDHELRKDISLLRAADLAEQAGRIMLGDLDEWRLVNQQRNLSVA